MKSKNVRNLLLERKSNGSKIGERNDGARIGLVIEGGGMRGIVSGAMTAALENLGLTQCFDAVYGASAGAMAGAYFIAGTARSGATIYYEHINNKRFVNPWRLLSGKPILNLNFLVDEVFENKIPLSYAAIQESKCDFSIVATNANTGLKHVFKNLSDTASLKLALKASAANPLIAGPPIIIDNVGYWDAILSESIPLQSALDDGCTHTVILRSRPKYASRSPVGTIEKALAMKLVKSYSTKAFDAYLEKSATYTNEVALIEGQGSNSLTIAPTEGVKVSQTSSDRKSLVAAAVDGYRNAINAFDENSVFVGPMIGHF
jgi:predicted patatin/cPLA2 family phospholipase